MLHLVMVLVLRKNSGLIALLELINRKISFTFSWSSSWSRSYFRFNSVLELVPPY